jgi:hypothetical protein
LEGNRDRLSVPEAEGATVVSAVPNSECQSSVGQGAMAETLIAGPTPARPARRAPRALMATEERTLVQACS